MDSPAQLTLQEELELRQDEINEQLDELNDQIENVLKLWTQAPPQPDEIRRAA